MLHANHVYVRLFYHKFKDLNIVTSFQCIGILEVNLVLPNSYFMVACFYFKTKVSKDIYDFATCISCQVGRCEIKISAFIVYFQCWFLIFIKLEEEKFRFWTKIEFLKPNFSIFLRLRFNTPRGSPGKVVLLLYKHHR